MIKNVNTGNIVPVYFQKMNRHNVDLVMKMEEWYFSWQKPFTIGFEVFGLVTREYPNRVQGLTALFPNYDKEFLCADIDIVESATSNKKYINGEFNSHRLYQGVGRTLIAFACAYSFECGLDGFIELTSKTSKIPFYAGMGGIRSYGNQVYFPTESSIKVIDKYLPGGVQWWEN